MKHFLPFLVALALSAAACGDNLSGPDAGPPPPDAFSATTWGDAERVWASLWCSYYARCVPDNFAEFFDSLETCIVFVKTKNCIEAGHDCPDPYPQEYVPLLLQCQADMEALECGARFAPNSCRAAFGG